MVKIDGRQLDAAKAEQHQYENEITQYPVEKGGRVADHVIAQPLVLTIDGIISDTPVIDPTFTADGLLPSDEALVHLRLLNTNREPIEIETSLGVYENMVCQSLNFPRDAGTGKALRFVATFQQILLITNERTTLEVEVPIAANKRHLGHKKAPESVKDPITGAPANAVTATGKKIGWDPEVYYKNTGKAPADLDRTNLASEFRQGFF